MPHRERSNIVADGPSRIADGSGREYAARIRSQAIRRAGPLLQRAGPLQRAVIHYRIARFVRFRVRRQLRKLAPFEALYALPSHGSLLSGASGEATRNA
jgi:hypothetical protein